MKHLLRIGAILTLLSTPAFGQAPAKPLQVNFTASADSFRAATEEYRAIWMEEGPRMVATMEKLTGLRFEPGPIEVSVYEGTSFSGDPGGRPMLMRASYPAATKRATLVHELGHRLANDIAGPFDHHELIFLFVYDAWIDLWGKTFADGQVVVESGRKGLVDYAGIWKKTLMLTAEERSSRLEELKKHYTKTLN
jgi:hypothetical protein